MDRLQRRAGRVDGRVSPGRRGADADLVGTAAERTRGVGGGERGAVVEDVQPAGVVDRWEWRGRGVGDCGFDGGGGGGGDEGAGEVGGRVWEGPGGERGCFGGAPVERGVGSVDRCGWSGRLGVRGAVVL